MPTEACSPVLYTVVCAAPPARQIDGFVRQAQNLGWSVRVILTPAAADWLDVDALTRVSGNPVLARPRRPDEPRAAPADAVAVVPATFNTVNKWAAGISDNAALGVLNEAIGLRLPVVVAPYAKETLTAHPAFDHSIRLLDEYGVTVLPTNIIRPVERTDVFLWVPVFAALPNLPV
ncbi:flavoprotein [Protofrankia coriariae]|uniref:Flavoprotein n=1 Tax=Protofrankia coriariae TaxID=1562887 RepID=A0ABR5F890_9ACTN|nr:flavoprotein [Protofrankia coriariae]KLL12946.1 flavoprotein [Protofrankia coriariae]